MSNPESPSVDPFHTPNIFSPLDSPSLMNSMVDGENLTQSIIEHKKIVEALEKAILESKSITELYSPTSNSAKPPAANDEKLLEFLKENREILEPIIKEQYVELVNIIEESKQVVPEQTVENVQETEEAIDNKSKQVVPEPIVENVQETEEAVDNKSNTFVAPTPQQAPASAPSESAVINLFDEL